MMQNHRASLNSIRIGQCLFVRGIMHSVFHFFADGFERFRVPVGGDDGAVCADQHSQPVYAHGGGGGVSGRPGPCRKADCPGQNC